MYKVIESHKHGYERQSSVPVVLSQTRGQASLNKVDAVGLENHEGADALDKSQHYMGTAMDNALPHLLKNNQLYSFQEEELED